MRLCERRNRYFALEYTPREKLYVDIYRLHKLGGRHPECAVQKLHAAWPKHRRLALLVQKLCD